MRGQLHVKFSPINRVWHVMSGPCHVLTVCLTEADARAALAKYRAIEEAL